MDSNLEEKHIADLAQDIEFSRKLLLSILPDRLPGDDAFKVGILFRPYNQFCVDFYDCVEGRFGSPFFMTGRVSSSGLAAALYLATARGILWTLVKNDLDVETVANNGSRFILENWQSPTRMMLDCLLFTLHPDEGIVDFINASGPPLIIVREQGPEMHEGQEAPLGAFRNIRYKKVSTSVRGGDIIAAGTAGIFALRDLKGSPYTPERLAGVLQKSRSLDANGLIDALDRDLEEFTGGRTWREDIVLVAVKLQ
jgi:serine phosphatase RsbU (regulator of sigma subunit)